MWFKKKELLPDLPGDDELPKLSEIDNRVFNDGPLPELKVQSLPSFPFLEEDNVNKKQLIKQESDIQKSNFEIPQSKYQMGPEPKLDLVYSKPNHLKPSVKSAEPIYIRLDKFQTTQVVIEEIKEKIWDIEKTLAKIKEIKEREEKELEEWEREIKIMKSRIDNIDNSIFNRLG